MTPVTEQSAPLKAPNRRQQDCTHVLSWIIDQNPDIALKCTAFCFTQCFWGTDNSLLLSLKPENKEENKGIYCNLLHHLTSTAVKRWDDWAETSEKRIRSEKAARVNEANGTKCRICFLILFQAGTSFLLPSLPSFSFQTFKSTFSLSRKYRARTRSFQTDVQQQHSLGLIHVHYRIQNLLLSFSECLVMWHNW